MRLKVLEAEGPNADFVPAEWLAFAGDREGTLTALTAMVQRLDPESLKIPINPAYDFLQNEKQYQTLVETVKASVR